MLVWNLKAAWNFFVKKKQSNVFPVRSQIKFQWPPINLETKGKLKPNQVRDSRCKVKLGLGWPDIGLFSLVWFGWFDLVWLPCWPSVGGGAVAGYLGILDRWLGLSYHLTLLLSPKYLQKCGHSKKCPPGRTSCCSQRMKGQESWLGSSKHIILSQLNHLNKYILSDKNPNNNLSIL